MWGSLCFLPLCLQPPELGRINGTRITNNRGLVNSIPISLGRVAQQEEGTVKCANLSRTTVEYLPWAAPTPRMGSRTPTSVSSPTPHPLSGAKGLGAASFGATALDICLHERVWQGQSEAQGKTRGDQQELGGGICARGTWT